MKLKSTGVIAAAMAFVPFTGCSSENIGNEAESTSAADLAVSDCAVVWEKELMITDPSVVRDTRAQAMGPWAFGGVMTAIAGTTDAQSFVKSFVESWLVDQNVSGEVVSSRPRMEDLVLAPWKARSANGTYDLATAPFELLAIVYRVDLRKQSIGSAGEARFVYGVRNGSGQMLPFTVIAEFGLPLYGGHNALDWANDWHALGKLALGSSLYNQKLENITNQFTHAAAQTGVVPGTSLKQIRSNEIALDLGTGHAPQWQLREWHLEPDGYLHLVPLALTPSNQQNGTSLLAAYVLQNARAIAAETHHVPTKFRGVQFGAGAADVPSKDFTWQVPNVPLALKQQFSIQTCNGCHAGATGTTFLHVAPGIAGAPATLSDFVIDDMTRRTTELQNLLGCR